MKNPSDSNWEEMRLKILGLGDTSVHKTHYANLRQRLSELEKAECRILKLNRLYKVITEVNKTIVKTHTQQELFQEVCRRCVDCGGLRLVWIATMNANGVLTPVAWAGDDPFFIHSICIPEASPCTGAVRTGRSHICNDLCSETLPCRIQAVRRGYRSACAVPLQLPGNTLGTFALYSSEPSFFDEEEVRLLEDVASDISFACEAMNREQQRLRAEQVLRETHRRLETLIEASPVAMVAMDLEGIVTAWNRAAEEVFGWSRQDVIGWPNPTIPESCNGEFAELRNRILQGKTYSGLEAKRKRKDGSWVEVSLSVAPLRGEGGINGFMAIYVDVSERKRLEAQLSQAQKMETIGRLAGGVAHDFNNLLTVVNGHAELLLKRLASDDPRAINASEIRKAGQQATDLTRQLLSFSRTQVFQPRVVSVGRVVSDLESILHRLIGEDVQLTVSLGSGTDCVSVDPAQLGQVILNLVVNARDAVGIGGSVCIRTGKLSIKQGSEMVPGIGPGEYVTLTVSDNGVGIDEKTQSLIFEPFFSTKEDSKGTGLGLSTVWGIVKQSGGHVQVSSELNRGSAFTVYLPRVQSPSAVEEKIEACETPHGTETILLVEDREEVRRLTAEILESFGYQVLQAATGDEALSICQDCADSIGLVITDVMMPGMAGPELGDHINSLYPQMKILYVSGYAGESVLGKGTLARSAGFLEKPFSATKLATTVRHILAEHVTSLA
jgi:two-component system cell cycle sensor histidine kinase/response regulator CckA